MAKLTALPLEELYDRPRITLAVEQAILEKEDFSQVRPQYCSKVCRLRCKRYSDVGVVRLLDREYDVLVIQDHPALPDLKYDKSSQHNENVNQRILRALFGLTFPKTATFHVLNLLKCGVTAADMSKGKAPSASVLLKCRPYLIEEIRRFRPKVIISLTTTVTKALGLKKANAANRGEIHLTPDGIPVIITLHPKATLMIRQTASGAMWGPDYWGILLHDFKKARAIYDKALPLAGLDHGVEQAKKRIFVCRSLEDVEKACNEVLERGKGSVVSFDTETTGLDPWAPDAKLLTIQFGYRGQDGKIHSAVIPLWHRDNKMYDAARAWEIVAPLLMMADLRKIGHNVKFDILYIYATTGVRVRGLELDTMLVLHNINSGVQGNYSLKTAVWDWLPESDLGGYEDKLPRLTKGGNDEAGEEEADEGGGE